MSAALRLLASNNRVKELKQMIFDAKRQGDTDYAKELQEELDRLLNESK